MSLSAHMIIVEIVVGLVTIAVVRFHMLLIILDGLYGLGVFALAFVQFIM